LILFSSWCVGGCENIGIAEFFFGIWTECFRLVLGWSRM
jgi:hypothetical protein